jgi:hypothetical protein
MIDTIEIAQISETEFKIGDNKLSLIEGNTIYVVAIGEQTTELALLYQEICKMLSSSVDGKINFLIDLNKCGKNSPEARKIWNELTESPDTNKVATFGLNPVARVLASFVIGRLTSGNLNFYNTKEEAISWLFSKN